MKIKIIDLLNMISKGKEVPKKIKYKDDIYIHVDNHCYVCEETYEILSNNIYAEHNSLNDEIEIIEEDKKIEPLILKNFTSNQKKIARKVNEIIDYLNKEE